MDQLPVRLHTLCIAEEAAAEAQGMLNTRCGMGVQRLKKSSVYALILSHRRDKNSTEFYKSTMDKAEKVSKKGKGGTPSK
jgi:hypothetical protein